MDIINNIKDNKGISGYTLWFVSILLILPMIIICAVHFLNIKDGLHPTGFLQYDQFYYMANAREHFDPGKFSITYGLPFSHLEETPRIYFHPLFLSLGFIHNVTGWQPGYIYMFFGLLAAVVCVRIAIALYDDFIPLNSTASWLGLLFFIWGGGALTLAGIAHTLITSQNIAGDWLSVDNLFYFDPFKGFWFLNFGRNLYYSTEAYYHAVFLGTVLLIFRKKYHLAILSLLLMAASHPFSGIQLLLIVACWSILNRFILKEKLPSSTFISAVVVLVILHIGYYLFYLNTSPEHRWLQKAWSLDWNLPFESLVFAYMPLLLLIIWSLFHLKGRNFFIEDNRMFFLAIWALISLLLANHELFIKPRQPLHFTRGYIWIPLFLIASKQLVCLIKWIFERRSFVLKTALLLMLTVGALSDNLFWFGSHIHSAVSGKNALGFYMSDDDKDVFNLMNSPAYDRALVVSSDHLMGYLSTVYSPLRSWVSHGYNTPYFDIRVKETQGYFERGEIQPEWGDRRLFVISLASGDYQWKKNITSSGLQPVLRNSSYVVYSGVISALKTTNQK